ncbi:hypothetical protein NBG4_210018 [Candidatus Sulfobium mesophilum]|uniref:PBS lyase HEAT domain protein repeat-containing protein n=1 Tax=Candidatus Sulfobium mesophilum TaxID=2016548 RepID=A0A2U3QG08_9BACT|nr:hypothetical protein NBG4_210018 [Candidatus Sulfobium mesophilum]
MIAGADPRRQSAGDEVAFNGAVALKVLIRIAAAISVIFCFFASTPVAAWDRASILSEIQRDDWEASFLNGAALERIKDTQSTELLIDLIRDQSANWRLQIRGIRVLGEIHTPKAEDTLLQWFSDIFFHHGCPAIKSSLALSLGNFSGRRVAAGLIEGLDDPEPLVREASIVSLGRVGDKSAVPYLIAQLSDKSFTIRVNAIHSLGLLKDARAASYLQGIADNDSELVLKREALVALSLIRT